MKIMKSNVTKFIIDIEVAVESELRKCQQDLYYRS